MLGIIRHGRDRHNESSMSMCGPSVTAFTNAASTRRDLLHQQRHRDAVSAVPNDAADGRSQLWRSGTTLQEVDERAPERGARAKAATRYLVTDHEPRRFSVSEDRERRDFPCALSMRMAGTS